MSSKIPTSCPRAIHGGRWVAATACAVALGLTAPSALAEPTVRLPGSGYALTIPDGWRVSSERLVDGNGNRFDRILRDSPADPHLEVNVLDLPGNSCDDWAASRRGAAASGPSELVTRPSYLPTGWHRLVELRPAGGGRALTATSCLDTLTGLVIAIVGFEGTISDPALYAASPLLVGLAEAAGVDSELPSGAAPPARAAAASPSTTSPSGPSAAPSAGPSPRSPSLAPAPDPGQHDYSDDDRDPPDPSLPRAELTALYLMPKTAPQALIITVGIDGSAITGDDDDRVGFALGYGASLGVTTKVNIPFDARAGMGMGLRFGRFQLTPLVGAGLNTMGAGADDSYKVPLAFYWYAEGRARLALGSYAIEAIGAHQARGSIMAEADAVPNENRVSLLLHKQLDDYALSLGARWVGFDDANAFGGVVGLSL